MMEDRSSALAAVMVLTLRSFNNQALAALNNALGWLEQVPVQTLGFQSAVEAGPLGAGGKPVDAESLKLALAFEVNRRVREGSWE
jgi:hypothetical protein